MYYLDTNTCIYYLNGRYPKLKDKIMSTPPGQIFIPSVVMAELLFGAAKSKQKKDNLEKVERFLDPFEIKMFDDSAAYVYAKIRHDLEKEGSVIGPNDLLIASIVKTNKGVIITGNIREFSRIKGLKIQNWVE